MVDHSIKILCVDDQHDAMMLMQLHLDEHFDCNYVDSPMAALEALEQSGPFAVVVTDYIMPDMDGIELLQVIKQRWPDVVGIMVTAMDDQGVAIAALHEGKVYRFIHKPWEADEIVRAVTDAAGYFRLVQNERALREQLARTNAELGEKVRDLGEANELLEYWVEFSPAVLYSSSCDNGQLHPSYISKNFHRLAGFERTAAIIDPQFWRGLVHPEDAKAFDAAIAELVSSEGTHLVAEYRVRHRDGNYLTVIDSIRAVHDAEGQTIELVGAWLDVSARP